MLSTNSHTALNPQSTARPAHDVRPYARKYTSAGLPVIPVGPDKVPTVKGWQRARVGQHLDLIGPDDLIGIVLGAASGREVIEIDGDLSTLYAERFPDLQDTWIVQSPSGGLHFHYRVRTLTHTTKYKPDEYEHREISLMSTGRQIVVPPSKRPSGSYTTVNNVPPKELDSLADVAVWIHELNGNLPKQARPTTPRERRTNAGQGAKGNISPRVIEAVEGVLCARGYEYNRNDTGLWLNGLAPNRPEENASWGYNLTTGYAWDFTTGQSQTTLQVCAMVGIEPRDYGGLYEPERLAILPTLSSSTIVEISPTGETDRQIESVTTVTLPAPTDALLSKSFKYLPKTSGAVLTLMHRMIADGALSADNVTVPAILEGQGAYGFGLAEKTVSDNLKVFDGVFLRKSDREKEHLEYVPLQADFRGNSRGRRATVYEVLPLDGWKARFLQRAALRIYEDVHPVDEIDEDEAEYTDGGRPILAAPKPCMMEAAGIEQDRAATVAAELHTRYQSAYAKQNHAERTAALAAVKEYNTLAFELDNPTFTTLPAGWVIRDARDFQAARLRGLIEANPGRDFTYQEMADFLGVDRSAVSTYLKRAGIYNRPQVKEHPLSASASITDQARSAARQYRGKPFEIVAEYESGRVIALDYDSTPADQLRNFVVNQEAKGATVTLKLRVASRQELIGDGQPPRIERAPAEAQGDPVSQFYETDDTQAHADQGGTVSRPRHYGDGYDPRWVYAQLALAVRLLYGYRFAKNGNLHNSDGERLLDTPTAQDLIDLVLSDGQLTPSAPPDEWLASMVATGIELGAVVRKVEGVQ